MISRGHLSNYTTVLILVMIPEMLLQEARVGEGDDVQTKVTPWIVLQGESWGERKKAWYLVTLTIFNKCVINK